MSHSGSFDSTPVEWTRDKDGLVVEKDLQDPNRLDAKIPTDVLGRLPGCLRAAWHPFCARALPTIKK